MPITGAADPPVSRTRRRDHRLFWWGQTASAFGSVFTAIALPVIAVVYLGASPGQMGMISAAAILPSFLFGLPAGALADRFARPRRVLMALDTICALAVAMVAFGVASHHVTVVWLIALAAIDGTLSILLEVVYFIHLSQLTDKDGIGVLRAKLQAGSYGAGVVGRLLAGPTIVLFGAWAALCVDVASYVVSVTALVLMAPVPPVAHACAREPIGRMLRGMGSGAQTFLGDRFHRILLVFLFVPGTAGAGVSTLTSPFLLRVVHVPTAAYGLLFAASGLMGLAGSLIAKRWLRPGRDPYMVTVASLTAAAVLAVLLPLASGPLPVAAAIATLGISLPALFGAVANIGISPLIFSAAREDAVGRTMAFMQVLGAVSGLVGALAGGFLGDWIGIRPAMLVLRGAVLVTMALCLPPTVRAIRHLRAQPEVPGESAPTPADPSYATKP